jgi:hypothetical protein
VTSDSQNRESGRGFIGFLVAIVVVGLVAYSLKQYYTVKSRFDTLDEFAYAAIQTADQKHKTEDDVRFEILKKAKEIGAPIGGATAIEVKNDQTGWRLRFAWDDELVIPGYRKKFHYVVDKNFRRF